MTDEHMMRLWADARQGFSADLDRGVLKLGHLIHGRPQPGASIGETYASSACATPVADHEMSATARAALAGVTACVATMALLVTVALLATAGLHSAAAYPVIAHTVVA